MTLPPAEYAEAWDVVIDTGGTADDVEVLRRGRPRSTLRDSSVAACSASTSQPTVEPDHSVAASVAAAMAARHGAWLT